MNKIAKYNIGDLVIHKRIRYRAIVIDVNFYIPSLREIQSQGNSA